VAAGAAATKKKTLRQLQQLEEVQSNEQYLVLKWESRSAVVKRQDKEKRKDRRTHEGLIVHIYFGRLCE
jgi:hypothetical protein